MLSHSVCASLIWQGVVKFISKVVVSVCTLTSRKWDIMVLCILVIYWFVRFFGFGNIMDEKYLACVLSHFSCVWLFVTLWIVAHQAPLSKGFSRQGYLNGLPCPPAGYLSDPGIESGSPTLQEDSLSLSHGKPSCMSTYAQTYQIDTFNTGSLLYVNYILIKAD